MSTMYCVERECVTLTQHTHCPACGSITPGSAPICAHHTLRSDEWTVANRTFCDLLHRGIEPAPVAFTEPLSTEWRDVA